MSHHQPKQQQKQKQHINLTKTNFVFFRADGRTDGRTTTHICVSLENEIDKIIIFFSSIFHQNTGPDLGMSLFNFKYVLL